jgi:hypothetical protein
MRRAAVEPARRPERRRMAASWRIELILLGGIFLLMVARFSGLFSSAELPNWDAPGHFFAVNKMAEYLSAGKLSGYFHGWLGGLEMFRFYPPLFYAIVAGAWLVTFKAIPLALLFRAAAFLAVFGTSVSLWLFVWTFFGRAAGRWALALSPALIFYPSAYSMFGVGGGAAFWVGLIPNACGLALIFVWLTLLERWRQTPTAGRFAAMTSVGAALALTHSLSLIFGGVLFLIWLAVNWRKDRRVSRAVWSLALSLALAAFWLLPFLAGLSLTAGSERGETNSLMYLLAIFPFHIPYLEVGIIAVISLALLGTFILVKERKYGLLALWLGSILFFLLRWPLSRVLPSVGIHYYRFLAVVYVLQLAVAAVGADWLWQRWAEGTTRRRVYLAVLAVLVAISYFSAFDLLDRASANQDSWRRPIAWDWAEFEGNEEAEALVSRLAQLKDANRIQVEMPIDVALTDLGSHFFFATRLPAANGQRSAAGLFVESAPQTPFLLSAVRTLQPGVNRIWGDERLRLIKPFVDQPKAVQLKRLGLFGINYLVATSPEMARQLEQHEGAEAVGAVGRYRIYRLMEARPLAYRLEYWPAVYLSDYGQADFRDIALTVFAGEHSHDKPVIESRLTINAFVEQGGADYSAVIVDGHDLAVGEANSLKLLAVPVIVLNPNAAVRSAVADEAGNLRLIDQYQVVSKNSRRLWPDWPAGWAELQKELADLNWVPFVSDRDLTVLEFSNQRVRFSDGGPLVINSGFSDRWQTDGGQPISRLTPDRLFVNASVGEGLAVNYSRNRVDLIGVFASLIAALVLGGYCVARRRIRGQSDTKQ